MSLVAGRVQSSTSFNTVITGVGSGMIPEIDVAANGTVSVALKGSNVTVMN